MYAIYVIHAIDNIGVIFMSENVAVLQQTKHVDVKYHFVQEVVQDGFLRIIFVRTTENDADLFTKNLPADVHERHTRKIIAEKGKITHDRKGVGEYRSW